MSSLHLLATKASFKIVVLFITSCHLDLKKFKTSAGTALRLDILETRKTINEAVINSIRCRQNLQVNDCIQFNAEHRRNIKKYALIIYIIMRR